MLATPAAFVRLVAASGWSQPGGAPQLEFHATVAPATGLPAASRSSTTIGAAPVEPAAPVWALPETSVSVSPPLDVIAKGTDCVAAVALMTCAADVVPWVN